MFKSGVAQPMDENAAQRKHLVTKNAANFKHGLKQAALVERKPNISQLTHQTTKPDDDKFPSSTTYFGGGDTLMSVDCAEDVDKYMRYIEIIYKVPEDYLKDRKSVTGRMRQILADWLFHVQARFDLLNETLSLTINLLDRSLIAMADSINKENLQLLGVTCLFISSKYEEIMVPNVEDFVSISGGVFTKEELFLMEQKVLNALNFELGAPHAIQFLRRYRFYVEPDNQTYQFSKYICDVASVCYSLAHFSPSTVAAVAIWLASYAFGRTLDSKFLFDAVFKLSQKALLSTARCFVDHVINLADPEEAKIYALRQKYQELALDDFTDEHISRLNDFLDYGVYLSHFQVLP
ncbi:hypothetical protein Mgra_00005034 [Meloidogyne graminicola]|uniref:G2/mitotic-specific cyclin-B3 n=1 Tax=Meloidogyne graminicola TaxID=189291 RepID=A0A8S9ZQD9_9BILA|nr:hypothetical protein Mgra_00005034 [Meloidogyne graminicola]